MAIKVMVFAIDPEATFQRHELQRKQNSIDICAYVALTDPILDLCEQHMPDIILFDISSINIKMYMNALDCPLLAVANSFDLHEHHYMRQLSLQRANTDLWICGYIQNRIEFLVTAIKLAMKGELSFYTDEEVSRL